MEERHGWELATFLRRLSALALDHLMFGLPVAIAILSIVVGVVVALPDEWSPEPGVRFGSLSIALFVVGFIGIALAVAYVIWWFKALSSGQTPGKQLVGIRAIRSHGEQLGWGDTFVREFVVKALLGGALSSLTGNIYGVVDGLWSLFDQDRQTIHDKMVSTIVVRDR